MCHTVKTEPLYVIIESNFFSEPHFLASLKLFFSPEATILIVFLKVQEFMAYLFDFQATDAPNITPTLDIHELGLR